MNIKNIILTIVAIFAMIVFAGELSNPAYWWVQVVAGIILFVIVKVVLWQKHISQMD